MKKILLGLTVCYCMGIFGYGLYHTWLFSIAEPSPKNSTQTASSQKADVPKKLPPPPKPLAIGTILPDFGLLDSTGQMVSLHDYRGKKFVLVEVFLPTCPHCQRSVPFLNRLQEKYAQKLVILSINGGERPGYPPTSGVFKTTFKANYTILTYPPHELLQAYHIFGVPSFYLVNRSGKIVWSHSGELLPKIIRELEHKL